jgi:uncharacterized protein
MVTSRMRAGSRAADVRWSDVTVFVLASTVLAWLVCLPLWLDPAGLRSVHALWVPLVMMFTPALATVVVTWRPGRIPFRTTLPDLGITPVRPLGRIISYSVGAIFLMIGVIAAGIGIAVSFGLVRLDLDHFSGYRALLPDGAPAAAPIGVLVLVQVSLLPIAAVFNGVLAFGEEVGWRGWLLPALQPLGSWPALLITGVIWGIWHTPLLLLGYNFERPDVTGVLLMIVGCVSVGVLLGGLRLRSGSLWPSVFGHGAFNAAGGLVVLLSSADAPPDLALAGPLGFGTWVAVSGCAVVALIVRRGRRVKSASLAA